jgi:hypothetical protein
MLGRGSQRCVRAASRGQVISGVDGTSRFSRVKFPCMPGVFDRAESDGCSHFAFAGVAFRTLEQRRHSDFRPLSRLNTLPACSPVNASRAALRLPAHDSGPGWLATPYLFDSCIRDFTPVYPGALQLRSKTRLVVANFQESSKPRPIESSGLIVSDLIFQDRRFQPLMYTTNSRITFGLIKVETSPTAWLDRGLAAVHPQF